MAQVKHPNSPRQCGMAVDGMLLLDKPQGLTSTQTLQQVKTLLNARKAGHTGSLGSIASGLLLLCFGETTKISSLFLSADKAYWVRIQLGITTDTGDREGQVQNESDVDFSQQQLGDALDMFRGSFAQIPPMYSALKQNGQPLYKLARKGVTVERTPRPVTVYDLSVQKQHGTLLELTLCCSSGFYVRTLATDLGEALGCGAHVQELRCTAVGNLSLNKAVTMAQIEAVDTVRDRQKFLIPTAQGLTHLPEVRLSDNLAFYLCRGQAIRATATPQNGLVRVYSDSAGFLGIGKVTEEGKIAPKHLFHSL